MLFFPHMTLAGPDSKVEDDRKSTGHSETAWKAEIAGKLLQLDRAIRAKVASKYASVREAFLKLDLDHDGWIQPQDFVQAFGTHMEMPFQDLMKIMNDKSSKEDGSGQLNYSDFSKWLGNSIHVTEGFYFRHDSKRNPDYDRHQSGQDQGIKRNAAEHLMGEGDVLVKLINKIRQQWKTVRKAFRDFNEDNDPYI